MVSDRILISISEEKSSTETKLKGESNMGAGQMNSNWKSMILNPLKEECWSYNTFLRGIGNKQNFRKNELFQIPRKFFLINIIARGFAIGDFNKRGCNPYNTEGTRCES